MPNDQRGPFTIPSGKLRLRGIDYTFPASQQAGVLLDDGAGNLGWGQHAGPFNAVINGDFSVFQIGNSPSPAVLGARYADCWYGNSTGVTYAHSQYTGAQQIGNHWATSMMAAFSVTNDPSPAAGDFWFLIHFIEGWRARTLLNGSALSFWIAPPVSGYITASLQNRAQTWSYLMEFPVTGGVWNYCTAVIPAFNSTIIGASNMTTNVGLYLFLSHMLGSTWTSPATGAWQNVQKYGTPNQTNFAANAGVTTYFWGVNLIPGAQPMPFIPRGYDYELTQAMRYRQILAQGAQSYLGTGQAYATTAGYVIRPFVVEMLGTPAFVLSNATHFVAYSPNATNIALSGLVNVASTKREAMLQFATGGSMVAGSATEVGSTNASGLLYAEAYPT